MEQAIIKAITNWGPMALFTYFLMNLLNSAIARHDKRIDNQSNQLFAVMKEIGTIGRKIDKLTIKIGNVENYLGKNGFTPSQTVEQGLSAK